MGILSSIDFSTPSGVHSPFTTAGVCTTEVSTDFETCEVYQSETSTEYGTAKRRCEQMAMTIVETEAEEAEDLAVLYSVGVPSAEWKLCSDGKFERGTNGAVDDVFSPSDSS